MNGTKKLTVGMCFAAVTAILAIASLIVYLVNVNGSGYFGGSSVRNAVLFCVLAAVAEVIAIVLAGVNAKGGADTVLHLVVGALQIITPVLLALCLVNVAAARAEGLGFIYFSNADVILEVQTPENLASATGAIANMICLGISALVGIISAFVNVRRAA